MKIKLSEMSKTEQSAFQHIAQKDGKTAAEVLKNINAILNGNGSALHRPRETYL